MLQFYMEIPDCALKSAVRRCCVEGLGEGKKNKLRFASRELTQQVPY